MTPNLNITIVPQYAPVWFSQRLLLPCGDQTSLAYFHQGFCSRPARGASARWMASATGLGAVASLRFVMAGGREVW
jgi:hypothetical protein